VGCFVLLLAFISPRFALVVTWLFTNLLDRAFDAWIVPLAGFFLLPWTTLAYAWMWDSHHAVRGLEWFLIGFAFIVDLGAYGGGGRRRRHRHD
jgi:hypothetical protein